MLIRQAIASTFIILSVLNAVHSKSNEEDVEMFDETAQIDSSLPVALPNNINSSQPYPQSYNNFGNGTLNNQLLGSAVWTDHNPNTENTHQIARHNSPFAVTKLSDGYSNQVLGIKPNAIIPNNTRDSQNKYLNPNNNVSFHDFSMNVQQLGAHDDYQRDQNQHVGAQEQNHRQKDKKQIFPFESFGKPHQNAYKKQQAYEPEIKNRHQQHLFNPKQEINTGQRVIMNNRLSNNHLIEHSANQNKPQEYERQEQGLVFNRKHQLVYDNARNDPQIHNVDRKDIKNNFEAYLLDKNRKKLDERHVQEHQNLNKRSKSPLGNLRPKFAELREKFEHRASKLCQIVYINQQREVKEYGYSRNNHVNKNQNDSSDTKKGSCLNKLANLAFEGEPYKGKRINKGDFGNVYRLFKQDSSKSFIIKDSKATVSLLHDNYVPNKTLEDIEFGMKTTKNFNKSESCMVEYKSCCVEAQTKDFEVEYIVHILMDDYGIDLRNFFKNTEYYGFRTDVYWKYQVIEKIVLTVKKLHDTKIIHRDLKPENIFMLNPYQPYVGDFGFISQDKQAETVVGSSAYVAPEVGNGIYDTKVDIYSLGQIIFEILNSGFYLRSSFLDDIKYYCLNLRIRPRNQETSYPDDAFVFPQDSIERHEQEIYCKNHQNFILSMMNIDPVKRPSIDDVVAYFKKKRAIDIKAFEYQNSIYEQNKDLVTAANQSDDGDLGYKTRLLKYIREVVVNPVYDRVKGLLGTYWAHDRVVV